MYTQAILAAAALNGLLAGASLDQSIKQVPSRHRIGVKAYAVYVRGADLGTGILWYALLANTAVLATFTSAFLGWRAHAQGQLLAALGLSAFFSIAHTVTTFGAAPTLLRARAMSLEDEHALKMLFNRFARWQAFRVSLQVLTFATSLWAVSRVWSAP